ncbi:unnamed protein product, partial [Amoebophrya sp. A25]
SALWRSAVDLCTQLAVCPVPEVHEGFLDMLEQNDALIQPLFSEERFLIDALLHMRRGTGFDRFLALIRENAGGRSSGALGGTTTRTSSTGVNVTGAMQAAGGGRGSGGRAGLGSGGRADALTTPG